LAALGSSEFPPVEFPGIPLPTGGIPKNFTDYSGPVYLLKSILVLQACYPKTLSSGRVHHLVQAASSRRCRQDSGRCQRKCRCRLEDRKHQGGGGRRDVDNERRSLQVTKTSRGPCTPPEYRDWRCPWHARYRHDSS